jgi:putative ABC transport system permease protein
MSASVHTIPALNLLVAFVPVAVVIVIMFSWSLKAWSALYSVGRMLIQLLLIGYVLVYVFETNNSWFVAAILSAMLIVASWISLSPLPEKRRALLPTVLLSLAFGGGLTLLVMIEGVLLVDPWYLPSITIPLAGMIFANSMNSISLAAERFESEIRQGADITTAKQTAMQTGLIPVTNSMLAVGLVALPGMMTGQILSGVSPLIAARYQIMVMCMLFGASGLSTVCYLQLVSQRLRKRE